MLGYHYEFREPLTVKDAKNLEADKVGAVIEALPGDDKPGALVREAKASRHYLHNCFDWNDRTAAHAHRLQTARGIIRCVVLIEDANPEALPIPAFVSISTGKSGGAREYFSTPSIVDNAQLQLRLMRDARTDLMSWLKRYTALRSVSPLVEVAVKRLDAQITAAVADTMEPV